MASTMTMVASSTSTPMASYKRRRVVFLMMALLQTVLLAIITCHHPAFIYGFIFPPPSTSLPTSARKQANDRMAQSLSQQWPHIHSIAVSRTSLDLSEQQYQQTDEESPALPPLDRTMPEAKATSKESYLLLANEAYQKYYSKQNRQNAAGEAVLSQEEYLRFALNAWDSARKVKESLDTANSDEKEDPSSSQPNGVATLISREKDEMTNQDYESYGGQSSTPTDEISSGGSRASSDECDGSMSNNPWDFFTRLVGDAVFPKVSPSSAPESRKKTDYDEENVPYGLRVGNVGASAPLPLPLDSPPTTTITKTKATTKAAASTLADTTYPSPKTSTTNEGVEKRPIEPMLKKLIDNPLYIPGKGQRSDKSASTGGNKRAVSRKSPLQDQPAKRNGGGTFLKGMEQESLMSPRKGGVSGLGSLKLPVKGSSLPSKIGGDAQPSSQGIPQKTSLSGKESNRNGSTVNGGDVIQSSEEIDGGADTDEEDILNIANALIASSLPSTKSDSVAKGTEEAVATFLEKATSAWENQAKAVPKSFPTKKPEESDAEAPPLTGTGVRGFSLSKQSASSKSASTSPPLSKGKKRSKFTGEVSQNLAGESLSKTPQVPAPGDVGSIEIKQEESNIVTEDEERAKWLKEQNQLVKKRLKARLMADKQLSWKEGDSKREGEENLTQGPSTQFKVPLKGGESKRSLSRPLTSKAPAKEANVVGTDAIKKAPAFTGGLKAKHSTPGFGEESNTNSPSKGKLDTPFSMPPKKLPRREAVGEEIKSPVVGDGMTKQFLPSLAKKGQFLGGLKANKSTLPVAKKLVGTPLKSSFNGPADKLTKGFPSSILKGASFAIEKLTSKAESQNTSMNVAPFAEVVGEGSTANEPPKKLQMKGMLGEKGTSGQVSSMVTKEEERAAWLKEQNRLVKERMKTRLHKDSQQSQAGADDDRLSKASSANDIDAAASAPEKSSIEQPLKSPLKGVEAANPGYSPGKSKGSSISPPKFESPLVGGTANRSIESTGSEAKQPLEQLKLTQPKLSGVGKGSFFMKQWSDRDSTLQSKAKNISSPKTNEQQQTKGGKLMGGFQPLSQPPPQKTDMVKSQGTGSLLAKESSSLFSSPFSKSSQKGAVSEGSKTASLSKGAADGAASNEVKMPESAATGVGQPFLKNSLDSTLKLPFKGKVGSPKDNSSKPSQGFSSTFKSSPTNYAVKSSPKEASAIEGMQGPAFGAFKVNPMNPLKSNSLQSNQPNAPTLSMKKSSTILKGSAASLLGINEGELGILDESRGDSKMSSKSMPTTNKSSMPQISVTPREGNVVERSSSNTAEVDPGTSSGPMSSTGITVPEDSGLGPVMTSEETELGEDMVGNIIEANTMTLKASDEPWLESLSDVGEPTDFPILHIGNRIRSSIYGTTHEGYLVLSMEDPNDLIGNPLGECTYRVMKCIAKRPWSLTELNATVPAKVEAFEHQKYNAEDDPTPESWELDAKASVVRRYHEVEIHMHKKFEEKREFLKLLRRQKQEDRKGSDTKVATDPITNDVADIAVPKFVRVYPDDGSGGPSADDAIPEYGSTGIDVWGETLGVGHEWLVYALDEEMSLVDAMTQDHNNQERHHLYGIQKAMKLPSDYAFSDVMDSIIRSLLENLVFLSSCSVVHRDLRPENILCDGTNRRLRVSNFGNGLDLDPPRVGLDNDSLEIEAPGSIANTLAADVFSVALISCQLLFDLPHAVLNQELKDVGYDLDAWLQKALVADSCPMGIGDALDYLRERPGLWSLFKGAIRPNPLRKKITADSLRQFREVMGLKDGKLMESDEMMEKITRDESYLRSVVNLSASADPNSDTSTPSDGDFRDPSDRLTRVIELQPNAVQPVPKAQERNKINQDVTAARIKSEEVFDVTRLKFSPARKSLLTDMLDSFADKRESAKVYRQKKDPKPGGKYYDITRAPLQKVSPQPMEREVPQSYTQIREQDGSRATKTSELIQILAPAGQLGVIIGEDAYVSKVFDSSPIKDLIRLGDRIVAVDSEDVRQLIADDISKILRLKRASVRKISLLRDCLVFQDRDSTVENPASYDAGDAKQANSDQQLEQTDMVALSNIKSSADERCFEVVEQWLLSYLPDIPKQDAALYVKMLLSDGFDSLEMLKELLPEEDLYFMRKAHARALMRKLPGLTEHTQALLPAKPTPKALAAKKVYRVDEALGEAARRGIEAKIAEGLAFKARAAFEKAQMERKAKRGLSMQELEETKRKLDSEATSLRAKARQVEFERLQDEANRLEETEAWLEKQNELVQERLAERIAREKQFKREEDRYAARQAELENLANEAISLNETEAWLSKQNELVKKRHAARIAKEKELKNEERNAARQDDLDMLAEEVRRLEDTKSWLGEQNELVRQRHANRIAKEKALKEEEARQLDFENEARRLRETEKWLAQQNDQVNQRYAERIRRELRDRQLDGTEAISGEEKHSKGRADISETKLEASSDQVEKDRDAWLEEQNRSVEIRYNARLEREKQRKGESKHDMSSLDEV